MNPAVTDAVTSAVKTGVIAGTVARIRGAIQSAGRQPLSATAGTVPPEAQQHAAVLSVAALAASRPQMAAFVDADGHTTGFGKLFDIAEAWLDSINPDDKGKVAQQVAPPTDPTGVDYLTEVEEPDNPAIVSIRYGSLAEEADLLMPPAPDSEP